LRKTTEDYREEIRTMFIEKQWLKGYNLAMEFYQTLEQVKNNLRNDLYFCYIYLSIGARRLQKSHLAIEFGEKALKYATNKGEEINASREIANCYVETRNPLEAIRVYNDCIYLCDDLLKEIDVGYIEESYIDTVFEGKADCIHNKGDLLNSHLLIEESIIIYKSLLSRKNANIKALNNKISNAYNNINRIHTQLFTPLAL